MSMNREDVREMVDDAIEAACEETFNHDAGGYDVGVILETVERVAHEVVTDRMRIYAGKIYAGKIRKLAEGAPSAIEVFALDLATIFEDDREEDEE